jgi:hypothetical protein
MARDGAKREAYRILVGKHEEKDGLEDLSLVMTTAIQWV